MVVEVLATEAAENTDLVTVIGFFLDLYQLADKVAMTRFHILHRVFAPQEKFLFLSRERVQRSLVLRDRLLIKVYHAGYILANSVCQDQFRA